ncbi:uncharacterized protein LOC116266265 [Nymphaea colorata]|nr:uncharacterized protein LOC116266265 [Nymphaea colorata]
MDPESCSSLRCGKHPSQTFTGFCAHCLVERLSAVDPGQRKAPSCPEGGPSVNCEDGIGASANVPGASAKVPETEVTAVEKVVNCSSVLPGIESESCKVRVRQTLRSLFYSDNEGANEDNATRRRTKVRPLIGKRDTSLVGIRFHDDICVGFRPNTNGSAENQLNECLSSKASGKKFIGIAETTNSGWDFGSNSEARSSSAGKTMADMQLDETGNGGERIYFVSESRGPKSVANKYTQLEAVMDDNGGSFPAGDIGHGSTFGDCKDDQNFKKRPPVLLGQGFVKKILRWNMKTSQKKASMAEADLGVGFHDLQLQRIADNGTPCCRRESIDSNETCSWDGLLIGKALTRSLSVKEEANAGSVKPVEGHKEMLRQPGSLENGDCYSESVPHIRRMTKKVGSVDFEWSPDMKDMNKIIPAVVEDDNKLTSDIGYVGDSGRERFCGNLLEDWSCRGKFHGCGKIWSRVIASPFWGFVQKSENVLDRSLSECWHESRRERNRDAAEFFNRVGFHRNSSVSLRSIDKSQEQHRETSCSSLSTINADLHGFHSVWNKKKSYGVLGHSRSIHYSSPSNLDNGLLRFYLTPMRYNRRLTNRKSRRNLRHLW